MTSCRADVTHDELLSGGNSHFTYRTDPVPGLETQRSVCGASVALLLPAPPYLAPPYNELHVPPPSHLSLHQRAPCPVPCSPNAPPFHTLLLTSPSLHPSSTPNMLFCSRLRYNHPLLACTPSPPRPPPCCITHATLKRANSNDSICDKGKQTVM